jgi:hypothetical protein
MHRSNQSERVATTLDAVKLAGDPLRLKAAPTDTLRAAAVVLGRALIAALDSNGMRVQRAEAFDLIDRAGRGIGAELRKRTA